MYRTILTRTLLGFSIVLVATLVAIPIAQASVDAPTAVDIEFSAGETGYYVLDDVGRVHTFGNARYFGGSPALADGESAVSMSVTPSGDGYWIFTSLGRIVAYGAAEHFGDVSNLSLSKPIINSTRTASGLGYYMLGEDGGIFAFGDAEFFGSIPAILPGVTLDGRIVGIAPTSSELGYWLVGTDGGMFSFGDAGFFGSIPGVLAPGVVLNEPVVDLLPQGAGYLLVAADGGIFSFGDSEFHGSIPGFQAIPAKFANSIPDPVTSVVVREDRSGYIMVQADGTMYPFGNTQTLGQPELTWFFGAVVGAGGGSQSTVLPFVPIDPGNAWECSDFAGQGDAQRWHDQYSPFYGDTAGLDTDADGQVCESLGAGQLSPASFGPGIYRVGLDIAAGTYRARSAVAGCTWNVEVGPMPPTGNNDVTSSHTIVTIDATDLTFTTSPECGTWSPDLSPTTSSPTGDVMPPNDRDVTLVVGIDIAAGVWRVSPVAGPCAVERLAGFGGGGAIADRRWVSNNRRGSTYIEILPIDAAIHLSGCSLLTQAVPSLERAPDDPFGPGDYFVGTEISPGVWTSDVVPADSTVECLWGRVANFAPESRFHEIATGFAGGDAAATVTIGSTDVGFRANESCGRWTKID